MRFLWLALALLIDVRPGHACATAPPRGQAVRIAAEEALIVYDGKTEHFIRRAQFHSTTAQFGFLVPTPTVPALSEADDYVFDELLRLIAPPIEYDRSDNDYIPGSLFLQMCMMGGGAKKDDAHAQAPVRVLQQSNVGGYNATTVEADDAKPLTDWLGAHGFEASPQLTKWLERYVTEHWKITAFVIAGTDAAERTITTRAVDIAFPTDRPFYPYREPQIEMEVESTAKLAPETDRSLRVYFVSNQRYAATLGDAPWSAKVLQAGPIEVGYYSKAAFQGQGYMTVFVDDSNPRRGLEEVYFTPSPDKSNVRQKAQIVKYPNKVFVPVDVIALGVLIVIWLVRKARKTRQNS